MSMAIAADLPHQITVRRAAARDVRRLAEMNRAAYPDLAEAGVVYSPDQLDAQLRAFPEGQLVAELTGRIVGAISTFVVPRARDALEPHTWMDITDHGYFTTHDSGGDTLYLADIYVDSKVWGKGVGMTLYTALRTLCEDLALARIVAGGRLWGYHEHASRMSPADYVDRVVLGTIRDRVLGSQLRAGFSVRGILGDYLADPRSCNFATLLEWRSRLARRA